MKISPVLLVTIALGTALPARSAGPIIGRATVIDGDTIEITGKRIRLHGVDTPESWQTCGDGDRGTYRCGKESAFELTPLAAQCQPAPSSTRMACAPAATWRLISARCRDKRRHWPLAGRGRQRRRAPGRRHRRYRPICSAGPAGRAGGCRVGPRPGSTCPVDRPAPRPGTRPRSICRGVLGQSRRYLVAEVFLNASWAAS